MVPEPAPCFLVSQVDVAADVDAVVRAVVVDCYRLPARALKSGMPRPVLISLPVVEVQGVQLLRLVLLHTV